MKQSDLFQGFNQQEIEKALAVFQTRSLPDGTVLRQEGENSQSAFFLKKGTLSVLKTGTDDEEMEVARIEGGAPTLFSLTPLIDGGPSVTKLLTVGSCEIAELSREELEALERSDPQLAGKLWQNLARMLAGFLRKSDAKIAEMYKTLEEVL